MPESSMGVPSFSHTRLSRWRGLALAIHWSSVTDLSLVTVRLWGGTMISGGTSMFCEVSTSSSMYSLFSSCPS